MIVPCLNGVGGTYVFTVGELVLQLLDFVGQLCVFLHEGCYFSNG